MLLVGVLCFSHYTQSSIFTVLSGSILPHPHPLSPQIYFLFIATGGKFLKSTQLLEHQYLMESGTPFKDQHFKAGLARHIWIAHYGYLSQIKHSTLLQDRLFSKLIMTVVLPAVFLFLLCVCLLLKCIFFLLFNSVAQSSVEAQGSEASHCQSCSPSRWMN